MSLVHRKPTIEEVVAMAKGKTKYRKIICIECNEESTREVHNYSKIEKLCIDCQRKRNYELQKSRGEKI